MLHGGFFSSNGNIWRKGAARPHLSWSYAESSGYCGRANHRQERVELRLHTNMSVAGVCSAEELIVQTSEFGQTAIAITDNSTVQAFPEA